MKQTSGRPQPARPARPLQRRLLAMTLFALAGAGAWYGATAATEHIESRSYQDLRGAFDMTDQGWVTVKADGLRIVLTGTAPSEAVRLRAINTAGGIVGAGRIIDQIEVAASKGPTPPDFAVELLSNPAGVSLVGLVPASLDRGAARNRLGRYGAASVSDLLATADYPVPDSWTDAFDFGLTAAGITRQAKISIQPGEVTVSAIADTPRDKARIEQELLQARPLSVALTMDIRAPLPVIAPFVLRYVIDEEGGRFEACSADSNATRSLILSTAAEVAPTAEGHNPRCELGIGAPTPAWGQAAAQAVRALGGLGKGALTLSDLSVSLEVPATVSADDFDAAVSRLETALPQSYQLDATRLTPESTATSAVEFSAAKPAPDGPVSLRGRITNKQMRDTVETIARARFGQMESALRTDETTPSGWTVRVIAGMEVLSYLATGNVVVTPDLIQVQGVSGNSHASEIIAAQLAKRLDEGTRYAIRIDYDRRLDADLALPDGDECVARLNSVLDRGKISFAPGSAEFQDDITDILDGLAQALQDCEEYRIEIGGHTDSQGSESLNQQLSTDRANAVLTAMTEEKLPVANLTVKGYGDTQPVADNNTEEGREENRRIEMRLITPDPVTEPVPERGGLITGTTSIDGALAVEPVGDDAAVDHLPENPAPGDAVSDATPPSDTPAEDGANSDASADEAATYEDAETQAEVPSDTIEGYTPDETATGDRPRPPSRALD